MQFHEALRIATNAHKDQRDRAGEPYLLHALTVALGVFDRTHSVDAAIVGLLHDVVEDSSYTLEELSAWGLTEDQLRALDALTHREGESYADRITRLLQTGGPIGRQVKVVDLEHNMDIRRLKGRRTGLTERDTRRLNDYLDAWTRLTGL